MQRRYVLKPNLSAVIFGVLLFGGGAVFFAWLAANDHRGLIINGLIHLDPHEASIFYVVMGVLSAGFVGLAIASAIRSRGGRLAVELDDRSITIPGQMFRPAPVTIRFADIQQVTLRKVSGQEILDIHHAGGRASIARSMIGDGGFSDVQLAVTRTAK